MSKSLRQGAILLGFVALAVAMTWPLGAHLTSHVVKAKWYYDSMVNIHILGSRIHYAFGMSPGLQSAYDNYFCAPTPYSITNNENLFGLSLLYAPIYLTTGDPLFAYNVLLLLCLGLSGFFTYLLVRELTESALAGVLSGVAFAFCPYVLFELGRLQLVATQWIPLFALFLHRTGKTGRTSSLVGLGLTFVIQVGSCLYYAVFLVLYGLLVGTWIVLRERTMTRHVALRLVLVGGAAALLVLAMVYPNFRARRDFDLVRSQVLSARYAGKLEHLGHVFPENKALGFLHNSAEGPDEPIAFPGFTILLLALVSLFAPIVASYRAASRKLRLNLLVGVALAVLGLAAAVFVSLIFHTFLAGLAVALALLWWWRRIRMQAALPPVTFVYAALVIVSVVLFLGPTPFDVWGSPVKGLYFYLYRYVPGFDGLRYVSRFAVMIMLGLCVLGGYGAAVLLAGKHSVRVTVFFVLLTALLFELRNAPVTLAELPSRTTLPAVYKWLAKHPGPEPIATVPAYPIGYFGARNDYFALFHKRRTIDGKSSWMPPITHAYIMETRRFPRRTVTRMLQALGVKYLVVHLDEFDQVRGERTLEWLDNRPEFYKRRFASGNQYVFEVLPSRDPTVALRSLPKLPKGSVLVAREQLSASANRSAGHASYALDGNPDTKWATPRFQRPGDWFEVALRNPRQLTAIEFTNVDEAFETPGAFKVSVASAAGQYRTIMTWPELRIFRDQVFHPKSFIFRLVLPGPTLASAIRIELLDGVAGRRWVVHDTNIWALP